MKHVKRIGSVVAGLVVGSIVNMALVFLNVKVLYPTDVNFEDTDAFGKYVADLPWSAFVVVWMAHLGQTVVGGALAAYLSNEGVTVYLVSILTMMGTIMNNMSLPAPLWTWLEVPLHLVLARVIATKMVEEHHHRVKTG